MTKPKFYLKKPNPMYRLIFTLTFLISYVISIQSQEFKFGNVSIDELEEKEYPEDSNAEAAILYKSQNNYFITNNGSTNLVTEVFLRLKIYKKEGFEEATQEIYLFDGRLGDEKLSKINAVTYNLNGSIIEESELDKNQIFKTKDSERINKVSFTMPNVKEGSIIEIEYKKSSPYIWQIDEFQFQYNIPLKTMVAELRTPKGYRFKLIPKGGFSAWPKKSKTFDNRIGMDVEINQFFVQNIPAMKEEPYVDNIDNYRASLLTELVAIELPGYNKTYAISWGDVAKTIGNDDDYKVNLKRTNVLKDIVNEIKPISSGQINMMKAIFNYVKTNVKWNGMDGKFFYNGFKKTLQEKEGNAADINLLLVGMLREAGFDANPVVISTKENMIPIFPTVERLNYVIAHVQLEDEVYYLDATEEFSELNVLPLRDYNWKGIYIDNDNKVWKEVNIGAPPISNNMYALDLELLEDGATNGTFKSRLSNHSAFSFREKLKKKDKESYINELEEKYDEIEITNHQTENTDIAGGFVTEKFEFYFDSGAEIIDGDIFVFPLSILRIKENPFTLETRNFPVDFAYASKNTYMVKYKIPNGFKVKSVPEPLKMSLPENLGTFQYGVQEQNGFLSIVCNFEINKPIISTDYYQALRGFYKEIITKEKERIVIGRVNP